MTRSSRKHPRRPPSLIDSDLDDRFSPSRVNSDIDSETETSSKAHSGSHHAPTPKPAKRPKLASKAILDESPLMITYAIALFTAAEWKKAVTKRTPINLSFQLSASKPFDTLQAQMLVKIDSAVDLPQNKISHQMLDCWASSMVRRNFEPVIPSLTSSS
jgi:hypothetical protein